MTTIRREELTLPAAESGPDNPLPPLRPLDDTHRVDADPREGDASVGRVWSRIADEPLPARYDFRMRPPTP